MTQHVATYIYETTKLDGVRFLSRHGDDHILWAVFERPEDPDLSPHLHHPTLVNLKDDMPEILEASASINSPGPRTRPSTAREPVRRATARMP